jgi:hypothetical protein
LKEVGAGPFLRQLNRGLIQQQGLDPFKQFGKEVRNGKHIGKDQCPDDDSFNTDLNPSYPSFRFMNAENLFSVHLMLLIFQATFNNLKKSKTTYND